MNKRFFEDIKRGDKIKWVLNITGFPHRLMTGTAVQLVKKNAPNQFTIWMADCKGIFMPVTPSTFKGFVK